jgi:hypothetical protein
MAEVSLIAFTSRNSDVLAHRDRRQAANFDPAAADCRLVSGAERLGHFK